jgi:DNA-binding beta-propeller fold protein YncE
VNTSPVVFLALALLLAGCPDFTVVCRTGTSRCGAGCADYQSDRSNCGGCGVACGNGQVCSQGQCQCQAGATSCSGSCTVLETDAKNCGACGKGCAIGTVCEDRTCKAGCTIGANIQCGTSCVDPKTDVGNCGGCGVVCGSGQSCRGGACSYEVVAACFTSGQVTGLQAATGVRGPLAPMGTAPASLALYESTLLSADGLDRLLYQAVGKGPGSVTFPLFARRVRLGEAPNQVVVDAPYVYVVNSFGNSLQVLKRGGGDGGVVLSDAGLAGALELSTVAELPLGDLTSPEGVAKLGSTLYVPLYGGGGADADAGQRVVLVDVSAPEAPTERGRVDLRGLNLRAFDGGAAVARPIAVTVHQGAVYVALNNLDPDYHPAGPGLLARIDGTTQAITVVDLGAERCLNPVWLQSDGTSLYVSCAGAAVYAGPQDLVLLRTRQSGMVMLGAGDAVVGSWSPACPADAGTLTDGGSSCAPIFPGRFAVRGGRVFVGDQNAGRIFVLQASDAGLVEERGYASAPPIQACVRDETTGYALVSDVLSVP